MIQLSSSTFRITAYAVPPEKTTTSAASPQPSSPSSPAIPTACLSSTPAPTSPTSTAGPASKNTPTRHSRRIDRESPRRLGRWPPGHRLNSRRPDRGDMERRSPERRQNPRRMDLRRMGRWPPGHRPKTQQNQAITHHSPSSSPSNSLPYSYCGRHPRASKPTESMSDAH